MTAHTNRLIHESSPYLRQHAHNPVDWFPWGDEAFAAARSGNKPILLSIGYSACHWCHVMERESFENESIARLMNENFVCIKVDREERPDVDHIYMDAVQLLTGRGGWPLTVFLTPDGKPFYGGTYFTPDEQHGMPAFPRVLLAISDAYRNKPDEVTNSTSQLMSVLQRDDSGASTRDALPADTVRNAVDRLAQAYDHEHGGIGAAPKFPNTAVLDLFLRHHHATGVDQSLQIVLHTLRCMASGGIYDQLGGGFHRYSVDDKWLVPHFEKMLYDNAQLVPLYLSAYQLTGDLFFAGIARETLDYATREMRHPDGGFYSTQDADSEGHEGKFFVWEKREVVKLLGTDIADAVCAYWDITEAGNFENRNILHINMQVEELARRLNRDVGSLRLLIAEARARLFAARSRRKMPDRDEKILTSWNGLMITAFAKAAEVLGNADDRRTAEDAAIFLRNHLQSGDRLHSTFKDGRARLNGYLDDYAFTSAALLDLFEATQQRHYLDDAQRLTDSMLSHFWDSDAGGLFFTSDDHEKLIVRSKPSFDGSIPSGNSVAAMTLLRLFHYTGRDLFRERAEGIFNCFGQAIREQPFGFANMLGALDFYQRHPIEIALIGAPGTPEVEILLEQLRRVYLPNRTLFVAEPSGSEDRPEPFRGKNQIQGRTTIYVCRDHTCSKPVTTWRELVPLLGN